VKDKLGYAEEARLDDEFVRTSMSLAYEAGQKAERERIANTWYRGVDDVEMKHGLIKPALYRVKIEALTPIPEDLSGKTEV
jgi:hypothetical protein